MIELENVSARFGAFVLRDINLRVPRGGYCVLLGPPGSGKTTIVELICGLRSPDTGRIVLDGRDVTALDPSGRHVGYVPQDYALFPTLSVYGNLAFGLKVTGVRRRQVAQRVGQVADRLGITYLLGRTCRGLSGGERQRVALGRALVLEPKILLMDEPVSALDETTRQQICFELRSLHDALGVTTIHISHNFEETRSVGDMVAVLKGGRLAQVGPVSEVFAAPADAFVARFVRAGNILAARVEPAANGDGCTVELAGRRIACPHPLAGGPTAMLLRPIDARLMPAGSDVPAGRAVLPGTLIGLIENGSLQITARVSIAPNQVVAVAVPRPDEGPVSLRVGQPVQVCFDPSRLRPLQSENQV